MISVYCDNHYDLLKCVMLCKPAKGAFDTLDDVASVMFKQIPDVEKVRWEIDQYAGLLQIAGVRVFMFEYMRHPNQAFLRDLAVVLGDQLYLGLPKHQVRRGEQLLLSSWLDKLARDRKITYNVPEPLGVGQTFSPTFEGADFMTSGGRVFVSAGNRTSRLVSFELGMRLASKYTVHTVDALPEGIPQHLLGHKQFVAPGKLLSRTELSDAALFAETVIHVPEHDEVVERFAMNITVIAPNLIAMPEGCPWTQNYFENAGIKCLTTPMQETSKMGGALTCLTLPLLRQRALQ